MKLLGFLLNSHNHYWGVPHPRNTDNKLVQTCYECSAEREIKADLRPAADNEVTPPIDRDHLAA